MTTSEWLAGCSNADVTAEHTRVTNKSYHFSAELENIYYLSTYHNMKYRCYFERLQNIKHCTEPEFKKAVIGYWQQMHAIEQSEIQLISTPTTWQEVCGSNDYKAYSCVISHSNESWIFTEMKLSLIMSTAKSVRDPALTLTNLVVVEQRDLMSLGDLQVGIH